MYLANTSPVSRAQTILEPDSRVPYAAHLKSALDKKTRDPESGEMIHYRLWYPEAHIGSEKYPLIIYLDSDRGEGALMDEWNVSTLIAQWLSSEKYVVVQVDYPPLSKIDTADPWETQLSALNSVIDELADNEFIDMSRIGITGFHYNAYLFMANLVIFFIF